jgi:ribosome-associated heat shock protein Hsp15
MEEGVRIDKWLWNVRIFKTRSLATDACRSGKVRIGGNPVKASHELKIGEIISDSQNPIVKTLRVAAMPAHRIGPKLVEQYLEDLTPSEEYEKLKIRKEVGFGLRLRGLGRPTKKERRDIEILKKYLDS